MSLPPPTEDEQVARGHFRALRELARRHGLTGLSMGTTHDFELAIEEGATAGARGHRHLRRARLSRTGAPFPGAHSSLNLKRPLSVAFTRNSQPQ